jgi:hypothetical protein
MAYIRVIYRTKQNDFDYVSGDQLDTLINGDEITHFYRPSEKRWVNVKCDPIRAAEDPSPGLGRRKTDTFIERRIKKQPTNPGRDSTNWVEALCRHIESIKGKPP